MAVRVYPNPASEKSEKDKEYIEKYGATENEFTERLFQHWCGIIAISFAILMGVSCPALGAIIGFLVVAWFAAKGIVIFKYRREKKGNEKLG